MDKGINSVKVKNYFKAPDILFEKLNKLKRTIIKKEKKNENKKIIHNNHRRIAGNLPGGERLGQNRPNTK